MKVFKFGGASLQNATAIRNMCRIIQNYPHEKLLIVVSAMGKTTNALEEILRIHIGGKDAGEEISRLFYYHLQVVEELFGNADHDVFADLQDQFKGLEHDLKMEFTELREHYDRIVSYGELISSQIVNHFINDHQFQSRLIDARKYIKTDSSYREAKIDWQTTQELISRDLPGILKENLVLTQGFIGSDSLNKTTTLGREGSDYSAAIFASCLQAESVIIWKDVPGILNADPKKNFKTTKFEELSYNEAAEMTYYGASVIHPKTIKPLANKKIPLWVRSFIDYYDSGTCIHDCFVEKSIPTIIFKANQSLISFNVLDFSFIDESNLSLIFHTLDRLNIKINMMQNSAITFSVCVDNQDDKIEELIHQLKNDFKILYNENLELITVKNYDAHAIDFVNTGRNILLEQRTRHNYQIVVAEE